MQESERTNVQFLQQPLLSPAVHWSLVMISVGPEQLFSKSTERDGFLSVLSSSRLAAVTAILI